MAPQPLTRTTPRTPPPTPAQKPLQPADARPQGYRNHIERPTSTTRNQTDRRQRHNRRNHDQSSTPALAPTTTPASRQDPRPTIGTEEDPATNATTSTIARSISPSAGAYANLGAAHAIVEAANVHRRQASRLHSHATTAAKHAQGRDRNVHGRQPNEVQDTVARAHAPHAKPPQTAARRQKHTGGSPPPHIICPHSTKDAPRAHQLQRTRSNRTCAHHRNNKAYQQCPRMGPTLAHKAPTPETNSVTEPSADPEPPPRLFERVSPTPHFHYCAK